MARPGLNGHRKFRRLARALGSRIAARGVLELLWDSCYESGDEYLGTSDDLESIVEWTGEPGGLTRALLSAGAPEGHGFIDPVDESPAGSGQRFRVHDLWHHAPDYVAKRRRRELERTSKIAPDHIDGQSAPNGGHRQPTPDWSNGVPPPPSPSPSPSPSHSPGFKNVSPAPPAAREPADDSPGVLMFPTVGAHGSEWTLTSKQIGEWSKLFPGLDVEAEARKALAWVKATPGRRKTTKGMAKFLVGWLSRTTNSAPRGGYVPQSKTAGNLASGLSFATRITS